MISFLEPNERPDRDTRIVVRFACPIDFVARFQAQPNWTQMSFYARAGVKNSADVLGSEIINGAYKPRGARRRRTRLEVDESAFDEQERPDGVTSANQFEPSQAMQDFQIAGGHGQRRAVGADFRESLFEVIVH